MSNIKKKDDIDSAPAMAADMTMRDYFAIKALPIMFQDATRGETYDEIARSAYAMADTLLRMSKE